MVSRKAASLPALVAAVLIAGCASGSHRLSPSTTRPPTTPSTNATSTPSTTTTVSPVQFQSGYYIDGNAGTPHYVLTVTTTGISGFSGWMFFVYQDGHTSETFHYHSSGQPVGTFTILTDTTTDPFPFQNPTSYAHVGSQPIPPGHTYEGTYRAPTIMLAGCSRYLYWASPSNTPVPSSCSFFYNGNSIQ